MKNPTTFIVTDRETGGKALMALAEAGDIAVKNGKTLEVVFGQFQKDRTILANDYLHGWLFRNQLMRKLNAAGIGIPADDGQHYDWCVDSLKIFFKAGWFRDQIIEPTFIRVKGKRFEMKEFSPSNLNSAQFSKYTGLISDYSANRWGVVIEAPIEGKYAEMYKELKLA